MDLEKEIQLFEKEFEISEQNLTLWDKIDIFYHRTVIRALDFFRYDLKQGLKNFWRYRKVIWRHRWYDYGFFDDVVLEMMKERAEQWKNSHYIGWEKDEKEIKIIVELLSRLEDAQWNVVEGDLEDKLRKDAYRRIGRKRFWD